MADHGTTIGRRIRNSILLAVIGTAIAVPAFADEEGDDRQPARTLEWATVVSDDGIIRPEIIEDLQDAEFTSDAGVTPTGVEWSRISFVDPAGVEWSRTLLQLPEGGTRTVVAAREPSGVLLSEVNGVRADGTAFVQTTFVNAGGDTYVRRQPGHDIRGVEWTRKY